VNEYTPTQGIARHVDRTDVFASCVASLSLGQECVVDFFHPVTKQTVSFVVAPRSLYVMSGASRYTWQHGIALKVYPDANYALLYIICI
jgi:alkylated DNA repair protein alkB family protein 8